MSPVRPVRAARTTRAVRRGALLAALALCAATATAAAPTPPPTPTAPATGAPAADGLPEALRPLVRPAKKYLGVSRDGAPHSMAPVDDFGRLVGKAPNLVVYYAGWGDGFDASGVRNAWRQGALTAVSWEPHGTTPAAIAAGTTDAYVRAYARAVRTLDLPIALSFADEMNGDWEQWGTTVATPAEYVAAWRHLRAVFREEGADKVIWTWSPNIVDPAGRRVVPLRPYYPGDDQVDWVGLIGYFTDWDPHTFRGLFGPTLDEIRAFADKPVVLLETGAMPGARRAEHVRALCEGVAADADVVAVSWFDHDARYDWRLTTDQAGVAEFRSCVADARYGFDVRTPPPSTRHARNTR
ncbi:MULTISPECIES: glycoside hydrolase family 26 protein [unclassified Streptomyces]|uniref:glycoside hydrolase family 26 protein n=1 Tax=unclassified Streptomyces TaxID=2593676 RepID=UPI0038208D64